MSQINPFLGSIIEVSQVQQQQSAEKARQLRRAQNQRDSARTTADFDGQDAPVENTDSVSLIHDQNTDHPPTPKRNPPKQKSADEDSESHIDLKA